MVYSLKAQANTCLLALLIFVSFQLWFRMLKCRADRKAGKESSICGRDKSSLFLELVLTRLCFAILLGTLLPSTAAGQSGAAVPAEGNEISVGSACSAFGLGSGTEVNLICDKLAKGIQTSTSGWEEVEKLADQLIERDPRNGIGYFGLGFAQLKQGRLIPAARHFQAAVDRSPEVAVAHINLGLSYAAIQQYKLFEDEMRWVMTNEPQEPLPYYYLGRYYSKDMEQPDKGAEFFWQALERNTHDFKSRYHLGHLSELKGELERAKADYELAVAAAASQKASYGWPLLGLARICLQRDNLSEALRYAQQSVAIDPMLGSGRLLLGKLYLQTGEVSKAIAELKVAADLLPTDATPHYLLSGAYLKMKMPDLARREQEMFLQIKATYPDE